MRHIRLLIETEREEELQKMQGKEEHERCYVCDLEPLNFEVPDGQLVQSAACTQTSDEPVATTKVKG